MSLQGTQNGSYTALPRKPHFRNFISKSVGTRPWSACEIYELSNISHLIKCFIRVFQRHFFCLETHYSHHLYKKAQNRAQVPELGRT